MREVGGMKIGGILFTITFALAVIIGLQSNAFAAAEDGSATNPWIIDSEIEMRQVGRGAWDHDSNPATPDISWGLADHYTLNVDITLTSDWTPIGDFSIIPAVDERFNGMFDGNGHSISGLVVNTSSPNADNNALFGLVKDGIIKNLTIESPQISGANKLGAIVGHLEGGQILNCTVNNPVITMVEGLMTYEDWLYTGGVAGEIVPGTKGPSLIKGCVVNNPQIIGCDFNYIKYGYQGTGGIVGKVLNSNVEDCKVLGGGSIKGDSFVGGVVGDAWCGGYALINNCVNEVTIIGRTYGTGGIVGMVSGNYYWWRTTNGHVTNCINRGEITSTSWGQGGISGDFEGGEMTNCINYADITSKSGPDNKAIGGLVGCFDTSIMSNCTNYGDINAPDYERVGGLVGQTEGRITDCVNYGNVTGSFWVGGALGFFHDTKVGQIDNVVVLADSVTATRTTGTPWIGRVVGNNNTNTNMDELYANLYMTLTDNTGTYDLKTITNGTNEVGKDQRHGAGAYQTYIIQYFKDGEKTPFLIEPATSATPNFIQVPFTTPTATVSASKVTLNAPAGYDPDLATVVNAKFTIPITPISTVALAKSLVNGTATPEIVKVTYYLKHVVHYEPNTTAPTSTVPPDKSYTTGTTVTTEPGITRTDYAFIGWNTKPDGSGTMYTPGSSTFLMPDNDVTLYAIWVPTPAGQHIVHYDPNTTNQTSPVPNDQTYPAGAQVIIQPAISTSGNTFIGWNTKPDGSGTIYKPGDTFIMPDNDVTLYAIWATTPPGQHIVHYDPNTSNQTSPVPNNQTYPAGAQVTIQPAISTSGNTFIGWNTKPDGSGTMYKPGDAFIMPDSDVTLYAIWSSPNNPQYIIYPIQKQTVTEGTVEQNSEFRYLPVKPSDVPQTGDATDGIVFIAIVALISVAVVVLAKRIEHKK